MTFDRPQLLWLLAALAPLAAAFLIRRRRPRVAVPDLDAWLAALPRAPRRGWRAFRDAASLLLNLAAAAVIAVAAAGPRPAAPPHDDWALVFDTSASMAASDGRWKRTLEKAGAFARALPPGDRFRILEAGAVPRAIGGWREGGEGLPALPFPAEPSADLAGALELAGDARTVVFTDRDVPQAAFLPRVASPADNLAIEDLSFSRAWASPQIEVEARVANYSAAARSPEVAFSCVARAAVPAGPIPPGGSARVRATLDAPAGGVLEARLAPGDAPGDALAADDAAFAVVPPLRAARAVVLAPRGESPFLRSALAALAPALDAGSGVADVAAESDALAAGADVFFYDRCAPSRPVRAVLFAAGSGPPVETPAVTAWASDHPLLRDLDLSRLRIARARPFPRDPALSVLVDSAAGPLAVASDASVSLAFALEDSNLPLLAAFPLFVRNCVEEFSRERPLPAARTGDWTSPFPGSFEAWRDGTAWPHTGPWRADRPGVVVFTRDGASRPLAVNFFNPAESALPVPPPGREPPSPRVDPPPAWALLAAAAAVLLGLEWTLLHGGGK